jgi:hypothetical protein
MPSVSRILDLSDERDHILAKPGVREVVRCTEAEQGDDTSGMKLSRRPHMAGQS